MLRMRDKVNKFRLLFLPFCFFPVVSVVPGRFDPGPPTRCYKEHNTG